MPNTNRTSNVLSSGGAGTVASPGTLSALRHPGLRFRGQTRRAAWAIRPLSTVLFDRAFGPGRDVHQMRLDLSERPGTSLHPLARRQRSATKLNGVAQHLQTTVLSS